jgi:FkbM family methyltransferase
MRIAAGPARYPLLRSAIVTSRARFFANDLLSRRGVHAYTLANDQLTVLLRHDNPEDTFVLDEVFGRIDSYTMPEEVALALRGRGVRKIVDLGANIGLTALKFLTMFPQAQLVALEPDATNARILQATLARNGMLRRSRVVRAAASSTSGQLRFVGGQAGHSHAAGPAEAGFDVPMIDVVPELDDADLLKMDIEGGEWPILRDERLRRTGVDAMCLEYHAHLCPTGNPRAAAVDLVGDAGFEVVELRDQGDVGFLWARRTAAAAE